MSNIITEVNNFVNAQIRNGNFVSKEEARKQIIRKMIEQDIDEGIAKGLEEVKAGKGEEMNQEWIENFMAKAKKRLCIK